MTPRGAGPAEVRILAPAKINVGLAVLGRRSDGYHELRTIFQTIGLADRLTVRRRRRGVLVRCAALPGLGSRNLAHRAAEMMVAECGAGCGVDIEIEKRIPIGGGLGGGSSDAAAALLGTARVLGVPLAPERLLSMAAGLGSDVPFFLAGGCAAGKGRGEILETLPPWPRRVSVLVYDPGEGLSTAAVYRSLDARGLTGRERAFSILLRRWREGDGGGLGRALFNDLEAPAFAMRPALADAKNALVAAGAFGALLSGSGSCVYGLFADGARAAGARRSLRKRLPGRFFQTRFLPSRQRWGVVKR